ncbi:MAG: hypothetical protein J6X28_05020 [Bacilli bacterium]|nr:hypothetical protein [Bacilli bacterium]
MKKKIIVMVILIILILLGVGGFLLYRYTEVFGKKLIPLKMNSIVIQYAPGMELDQANKMNEGEKPVIEIQEMTLKGAEKKEVQKALSKIQKDKGSKEIFQDQYEVIINKKITLQVGNGVGYLQEGKKKTKVMIPDSTLETLNEIVGQNKKKVLKDIAFEKAQLKIEGASITVQNKDNIQLLKEALTYYPLTIESDYATYDEGYKAEVILDGTTHIYLYSNKIGYLITKDGETEIKTYVIFINDLYDFIQSIYKVSTEE